MKGVEAKRDGRVRVGMQLKRLVKEEFMAVEREEQEVKRHRGENQKWQDVRGRGSAA